jgi:hypothetical protein
VVSTMPRLLYPRERPGTHCTRGRVGPRAGLDMCEKSRPHRDSIPGPSSQGRPLGGASGALAPGADFEGAPKRQSPTGQYVAR